MSNVTDRYKSFIVFTSCLMYTRVVRPVPLTRECSVNNWVENVN